MNMNLQDIIKPYIKVLNFTLSQKFKWFKKIELEDIKYGGVRGQQNFINPVGKIYVDSDWGHKQWKEYHYESPFPYDEEISFGNMIGGDLSKKIQEQFKLCFSMVSGEIVPKYMSFSWLDVELVDEKDNILEESIRRILREESRPLEIMRRTHLIDNEIEKILKNPYFPKKVCKTYINTEQFITSVCEFCFRSLYSNTFYMMDDTSEEWEKIVVFIYEYVKDRYSEILKDYYKKHCGKRVETNESDPKVGTGKKPKGSGRRLYTDENPSDTVSVKFKTKQDIIDTLNKQSFKSKPHKRQSQIINLIHQRVRAAYQNSKNSETKKRLKTALDYIEIQKEKSKQKTIRLQKK